MPSNSLSVGETLRQSEIRRSVQEAINSAGREAVAIPLVRDVEEAKYALSIAISEGRTLARMVVAARRLATTVPTGIPVIQPMTREQEIEETLRRR